MCFPRDLWYTRGELWSILPQLSSSMPGIFMGKKSGKRDKLTAGLPGSNSTTGTVQNGGKTGLGVDVGRRDPLDLDFELRRFSEVVGRLLNNQRILQNILYLCADLVVTHLSPMSHLYPISQSEHPQSKVYGDTTVTVGNQGCTSGIHCNVLRLNLGSSAMDDGAATLRRSQTSARLRRYY